MIGRDYSSMECKYHLIESRSNTGNRSPRLGRSPSAPFQHNNKSDANRRSRSHLSDSVCYLPSSGNEEYGFCERGCGCEVTHGSPCDHSVFSDVHNGIYSESGETCRNMALSAVMMSGGGGHGKHKGSNRNLLDADADQGWSGESSVSRSPTPTKCICDKIKSRETVIINVGGKTFETYKSTLRRLRTCKLASKQEMMKYYREDKGDFFFDRDPYAFNIILNYLRYGDLHLPTNLCGPALMRELEFWGVDEQDIERCCFQPYNTWKTQTKSLEKLEYDRKQSTTQTDLACDRQSKQIWRRIRAVVWPFLQDPSSSRAAKLYAWISTIFVFMSIFSFCAETHPFFQLPPSEVHDLQILYRFFAWEDMKVLAETKSSPPSNTGMNISGSNNTSLTNTSEAGNTTFEEGEKQYIQHPALLIMDLVCVFFFTLEFLTRLIFCPKKLRFCTSLQNIIDFIAIVPDYVEFILLVVSPSVREGLGFVDFIFILRMLRLCRLFRLIRHVPGLWILLYTLKASFNELLLMFVFLLIGMVMFASLLHFIEDGKTFSNIPVGFWWAVVTMTTVGYGDMVPVTGFGYIVGSICAISGLLMIAFTVPIIVSNFVLYYTHVQYGLSDKDSGSRRKLYDPNDDLETCSFHTTFTETSQEMRAKSLLIENEKKSPIPNNLSTDTIESKFTEKNNSNGNSTKEMDSNSNRL